MIRMAAAWKMPISNWRDAKAGYAVGILGEAGSRPVLRILPIRTRNASFWRGGQMYQDVQPVPAIVLITKVGDARFRNLMFLKCSKPGQGNGTLLEPTPARLEASRTAGDLQVW